MLALYVQCPVKPGCTQNFIDATCDLVKCTREEAGNIAYSVGCLEGSDDICCFIEIWQDEQALALHSASAHFKAGMEAIAPFTAGPSTVKKVLLAD